MYRRLLYTVVLLHWTVLLSGCWVVSTGHVHPLAFLGGSLSLSWSMLVSLLLMSLTWLAVLLGRMDSCSHLAAWPDTALLASSVLHPLQCLKPQTHLRSMQTHTWVTCCPAMTHHVQVHKHS